MAWPGSNHKSEAKYLSVDSEAPQPLRTVQGPGSSWEPEGQGQGQGPGPQHHPAGGQVLWSWACRPLEPGAHRGRDRGLEPGQADFRSDPSSAQASQLVGNCTSRAPQSPTCKQGGERMCAISGWL